MQLFDSWVGALDEGDYREFALPHVRRIFDGLEDLDVPKIHFGTATGHLLAAQREAGQATERRLWQTVQSGLLPERLPNQRGLRIAARYQPAEKALLIGGDFYDFIDLGEVDVVWELKVDGQVAETGKQQSTVARPVVGASRWSFK